MASSPTPEQLAEITSGLLRVFAGRPDVYGKGVLKPGSNKAEYFTTYEPVTADLLEQHVLGQRLVGVYPLVDGKVLWAAVDFDAEKDEEGKYVVEDPWEYAFEVARKQRTAFSELGLFSYIERSRSGTGAHLWVFFNDWVDGKYVRALLAPKLVASELLDRMYPVQASADGLGKQLGNLICLPFNGLAMQAGNGVFVDHDLDVPIQPTRFLQELRVNEAVVVVELGRLAFEQAEKARSTSRAGGEYLGGGGVAVNAENLRPNRPLYSGIYKLLSPFGCEFMRQSWDKRKTLSEPAWYAMLGQLTCFDQGREIAHIMSREHPKYDARDTNEKYDHATQSPPVGCQFIHDNFPRMACKGCPMTAPYRRAEVQLADLHEQGEAGMTRGGFAKKLKRVRAFDDGSASSGRPWGLGGTFDQRVRSRPGELWAVGALPSMGKTSLMLHLASENGRRRVPARLFSAETGEDPLYMRLLAHRAEIDSRALRGERLSGRLTRDEWERLEAAAAELDQELITFNYTASDAEQIYTAAEREQVGDGLSFDDPFDVDFDYLQFGQRKKGETSDYEKVSRFIRDFKTLGKVFRVATVRVYSQLVRQAKPGERPELSWFRDSGRIEADVDGAIVIHGERMEGRIVPREMHVLKQKEGEANFVEEFLVDQAVCRFDPARKSSEEARPYLLRSNSEDTPQLGLTGEDDE